MKWLDCYWPKTKTEVKMNPLEKLDAIRKKLPAPDKVELVYYDSGRVYVYDRDGMTLGSGTPEEAINEAYEKVCKPKGDEMGKKKLSDTEKLQAISKRVDKPVEILHEECDIDEYQLAVDTECICDGWFSDLSEAIDAAYKKLCGKKIKSRYGEWVWSDIREGWVGLNSRGVVRKHHKDGEYSFGKENDKEGILPSEAATLYELTNANPDLLPPTE
jgi:hypothetical protein